jgi:hypothetical protein
MDGGRLRHAGMLRLVVALVCAALPAMAMAPMAGKIR